MLELAGSGIWKKIEENDFERICEIGKLQSQNARLLDALKSVCSLYVSEVENQNNRNEPYQYYDPEQDLTKARAAIAEAERKE